MRAVTEPSTPILLNRNALALRLERRLFVEPAVFHDREQPVLLLENAHIGERIAVDEKKIGEEALLDLAELVAHAHDLPAMAGGRCYRFHGRHADHLDEIFEI